ncbi:hypothetical protein SULPSESMR1_01357 [Pseudosulfitobacter pseudonitzschiae]|jgi:hypothetical protein|uniref:Uncharacterized protein n=1 Tax=Pseudosulfitobacter pseudonitzschiae TaxID=1402135 RepID=A0A221K008_9RHOB|nr:hypothetical protein SULPSESMR1_01357 [Pseudosulfitobacter pseudonitzschiae]
MPQPIFAQAARDLRLAGTHAKRLAVYVHPVADA